MSIVIFILILSFLVLIHELGHFIVARRAGIVVEEFGIGYPPLAIKLFTWKGTVFSLNWIPFGGFVRMAGEDEVVAAAPDKLSKKSANEEKLARQVSGQFYQANTANKLAVILAGAAVNFLFGVVAFSLVFTYMGIPVELNTARIGAVAPESPAAQAGITPGVEVIAFAPPESEIIAIASSQELITAIQAHRGQTVKITTTGPCQDEVCAESAQTYDVYLRTAAETPEGQGSLGIAFDSVIFKHYPWWQMPLRSVWYGLEQALYLGQQIVQALGTLGRDAVTKGSVPDELAGPVGIVHQAQASGVFSEGPLAVLSFAGMLSVNLAIMNVLPIPPLDGGRAVIILLAPFVSHRRRVAVEYYANYGGYILLLGLIIFITARDISRVVFG